MFVIKWQLLTDQIEVNSINQLLVLALAEFLQNSDNPKTFYNNVFLYDLYLIWEMQSNSYLECKLTWLVITMGLPSRSLKLLLPRLVEEPPLSAGPGPSLPDRSARIRMGPLLNPALLQERDVKQRNLLPLIGEEKKQSTDNASCSKTALCFTVYLPCWSLYRHHSSIHALHPWVSGCATCPAW